MVGVRRFRGPEDQWEPRGEVENLGHQEPRDFRDDDAENEREPAIHLGTLLSTFVERPDFNDSRLQDVEESWSDKHGLKSRFHATLSIVPDLLHCLCAYLESGQQSVLN